jgi:hypothetical protein
MKKIIVASFIFMLFSCISTKSTIKNIDDNISGPGLNEAFGCFIITKNATDKKYGYNEDYPINVGFTAIEDGLNNEVRFLNALAGPNGEKIKFELKNSCCPFPTKKIEMGAGTLDVYEITWAGQTKPVVLYLNKFEKGELMIPIGFTNRK